MNVKFAWTHTLAAMLSIKLDARTGCVGDWQETVFGFVKSISIWRLAASGVLKISDLRH